MTKIYQLSMTINGEEYTEELSDQEVKEAEFEAHCNRNKITNCKIESWED